MRWFVRSKITHAIVKESDVNYISSITIDEEIIIMGFELSDQPISPKIVLVDQQNKFEKYL